MCFSQLWSPRSQFQSIQFLVQALFLLSQSDLFTVSSHEDGNMERHKKKTERSWRNIFLWCLTVAIMESRLYTSDLLWSFFGGGVQRTSFGFNHLPMGPIPNRVTLGFGLQYMDFSGLRIWFSNSTDLQHSQSITRSTNSCGKTRSAFCL